MVFSSATFLFLFLPVVLFFNFILKKEARNVFLLLASLFFYAWGEYELVFLMIGSIGLNYCVGLMIDNAHQNDSKKDSRMFLGIGVTLNLLLLAYFKYIHFIIENLNAIGINLNYDTSNITLPIGISFFTFQNISYLFDVYRKQVDCQRNPLHLGLYISLFPQLIAGPIVRYVDIYKEIKERIITSELFVEGAMRFIRGFAKKVLIANNVALIADASFSMATCEVSTLIAWLAILCYSLQIYFDFSGYSDMAIGLGKMLGFNFKENFNYPYIAKSVQEFWRRWHISLSTWFRDYLYIPLGGNRKGSKRTYVNLVIVFFITGLWHGASWNFVIWGLYHGFFLLIERVSKFKLPEQLKFLKHIYLLLVVMIGWVFFRAESFEFSFDFIHRLFVYSEGTNNYPLVFLNKFSLLILTVGIIFSMPIRTFIKDNFKILVSNERTYKFLRICTYLLLFGFAIMELAQTTHNPFIYFRF